MFIPNIPAEIKIEKDIFHLNFVYLLLLKILINTISILSPSMKSDFLVL